MTSIQSPPVSQANIKGEKCEASKEANEAKLSTSYLGMISQNVRSTGSGLNSEYCVNLRHIFLPQVLNNSSINLSHSDREVPFPFFQVQQISEYKYNISNDSFNTDSLVYTVPRLGSQKIVFFLDNESNIGIIQIEQDSSESEGHQDVRRAAENKFNFNDNLNYRENINQEQELFQEKTEEVHGIPQEMIPDDFCACFTHKYCQGIFYKAPNSADLTTVEFSYAK